MIRRLGQIDELNKETITRAITGNITSATTRTKRTTLARTSAARSSLSDQNKKLWHQQRQEQNVQP